MISMLTGLQPHLDDVQGIPDDDPNGPAKVARPEVRHGLDDSLTLPSIRFDWECFPLLTAGH